MLNIGLLDVWIGERWVRIFLAFFSCLMSSITCIVQALMGGGKGGFTYAIITKEYTVIKGSFCFLEKNAMQKCTLFVYFTQMIENDLFL
jgi:hypothetical protein